MCVTWNSTKCSELWSTFCQIGSPVNGRGLPKWCNLCNLKRRLEIEKWKQTGLTTSLSKHICQPCSCWEQRATFSSGNDQSYHERHFCALLSQHSTEINLIFTWNTCTCHMWVCHFFVNFGLLCTKWEFFKLWWCLHRPHGKCLLWARAFSLSCFGRSAVMWYFRATSSWHLSCVVLALCQLLSVYCTTCVCAVQECASSVDWCKISAWKEICVTCCVEKYSVCTYVYIWTQVIRHLSHHINK